VLGACLAGAARAQTITEFPIPTGQHRTRRNHRRPDGNLWFTEFSSAKSVAITTSGTVTEFPAAGNPQFIAVGSDGNVLVSGADDHQDRRDDDRGRLQPTSRSSRRGGLVGIAAGSDGNLWFTEAIGEDRPNHHGRCRDGVSGPSGGTPIQIAAGPDGNLWFTNSTTGQVQRITTAGVITEFPTNVVDSSPQGITAGPDGNVWFTDTGAVPNRAHHDDRTITEFPIPSGNANLLGITSGPDGISGSPKRRRTRSGALLRPAS
jgi:streptogramin lyase